MKRLFFAGFCFSLFLAPALVQADTICVDDPNDSLTVNTAECSATCDATPNCSLREALQRANEFAAAAIDDTIDLRKLAGKITLVSDLPQIGNGLRLTVLGPGAGHLEINGDNKYRLFYLQSGSLTLSDLTLRSGNVSINGGAAIYAPSTSNSLSILNSVIADSKSLSTANMPNGGCILFNGGGELFIDSSTIQNCDTSNSGGGITIDGNVATTTATILNTTIASNKAKYGGGIRINNLKEATLKNVTLSDNCSWGPTITGTAISLKNGTLNLIQSTIVKNKGVRSDHYAIYINSSSTFSNTVTMKNTALADNFIFVPGALPTDSTICTSATASITSDDCGGTVDEAANSFIERGCTVTSGSVLTAVGGAPDTDLFSSLQDNDGPTLTHMPLIGSPLLNAIPAEQCSLSFDQRGFVRPTYRDGVASCDIGAVELGCGNKDLETGEECDDGNGADGDGCSSLCKIEKAAGGGTTELPVEPIVKNDIPTVPAEKATDTSATQSTTPAAPAEGSATVGGGGCSLILLSK